MGVNSDCYGVIFTPQSPLYVFNFTLSTGMLSELKIMTSFFVKSVEQSELHSCLIERRMFILIFVYEWDCVATGVKVER